MRCKSRSRKPICALFCVFQIFVVISSVGILLFAPPAAGQMAFYPLTKFGTQSVAEVMLEQDRRLIGRTTIANGYVLQGVRPPFFKLFLERGILVVAVTEESCGSGTDEIK